MALPVTNRAARAAAHPLHLVEPEAAPLERQPARRSPLPFSCSTNLANDVTEQLRRAKLGSRALEVCLYLYRQTFGNAGWHRQQGQAEWQCAFDLAQWAEALVCNKSNLRRIRTDLEACHILCFEPDAAHPGQGRIGWNLAFAEWQPYDGRRAGRGRRTDLAERQQEDIVILPQQEDVVINTSEQRGVVISTSEQQDVVISAELLDEPRQDGARMGEQEGVVICQMVDASSPASKQLRPVDENGCKITTPAPCEAAQQERRATTLRKGLRKKETETPDVVSEAHSASSDSLLDSAKSEETHRAPATEAEDPPRFPAASTDQVAYWPLRQPHERTDLDYYQRVLREREKERVALLVRLAHERIGVPLERASYGRIGALAKQCGAALLVKHILLAAANHIDGDPLDYLTRLARGQQRKEAAHATGPAATSSYQHYTAEEASQLVWNTL